MYDTLAHIETQLAAIELDYLRKTYLATRPKFLERATAIRAIPDFWSTVIDEAPAEIDQRIQPRDVPVLSCLTSIDIERFEIEDADNGEPRSIKITLNFKPNEWLCDNQIEKKFYWRMSHQGWCGLVSEPVNVRWKNKDLTDGLLDLAVNLWEKELELEADALPKDYINTTEEYQILLKKVQRTPQDAISIFGFLGFRGHHISATESAASMQRKQDVVGGSTQKDSLDEETPPLPDSEIYPHGEEVAVALSEDLYPGATHYFTTAKKRDANVSDEELGSDADPSDISAESRNLGNLDHEQRPNKRMKNSA
ncbi:MAG: hypothetical protein Q9209_004641 [Squamulea sp. 1 TL-2023]